MIIYPNTTDKLGFNLLIYIILFMLLYLQKNGQTGQTNIEKQYASKIFSLFYNIFSHSKNKGHFQTKKEPVKEKLYTNISIRHFLTLIVKKKKMQSFTLKFMVITYRSDSEVSSLVDNLNSIDPFDELTSRAGEYDLLQYVQHGTYIRLINFKFALI